MQKNANNILRFAHNILNWGNNHLFLFVSFIFQFPVLGSLQGKVSSGGEQEQKKRMGGKKVKICKKVKSDL